MSEQPPVPVFVVIPVRDRHAMTRQLLRTLSANEQAYHSIYLFDNESMEPVSETDLVEICARTVLLEREGDAVIYDMWNEGMELAREASGREVHAVACLNNDLVVPPDLLGELSRLLYSDDAIGIVYPNYDGRPHNGAELQSTTGIAPTGGMSGFAFMIRGELGFRVDPQFRWWAGDADLEMQVRAAGKNVACATRVPVQHLEPYRSTAERPNLARLGYEDRQRFKRKYGIFLE